MITPSCFVVMWEFLQCVLVSWGSSSVSATFGWRVEGRCCRWGVERRQDGCGVRDVVSMGGLRKVDGTATTLSSEPPRELEQHSH